MHGWYHFRCAIKNYSKQKKLEIVNQTETEKFTEVNATTFSFFVLSIWITERINGFSEFCLPSILCWLYRRSYLHYTTSKCQFQRLRISTDDIYSSRHWFLALIASNAKSLCNLNFKWEKIPCDWVEIEFLCGE